MAEWGPQKGSHWPLFTLLLLIHSWLIWYNFFPEPSLPLPELLLSRYGLWRIGTNWEVNARAGFALILVHFLLLDMPSKPGITFSMSLHSPSLTTILGMKSLHQRRQVNGFGCSRHCKVSGPLDSITMYPVNPVFLNSSGVGVGGLEIKLFTLWQIWCIPNPTHPISRVWFHMIAPRVLHYGIPLQPVACD